MINNIYDAVQLILLGEMEKKVLLYMFACIWITFIA